ncbi:hypothetical protein [Streptomyces sp. HUAS ZL42]|uniref:Acg family FMN-binding oxidoreductase n=1 Tax=Streptomyces sp. HUAS ZL42 TaxID=3231715 RepID=UPI00345EB064
MSVSYESPGRAALHLARAAASAPSPHNSQPWFFLEEGHDHAFEVHADGGRWSSPLTDPGGREKVIACGAALFNVRVSVRHLGFRPVVDVLPEPANPDFLARVGFGAHAPATSEETLLAGAIPRRHTHRGPFGPDPVSESLLDELCEQARAEGAFLQIVDEPEKVSLLAESVRTAEDAHRADLVHVADLMRFVGPDGVPYEACRHHPDCTLLAGRDYLGLSRRYVVPARRRGVGTGTVAVLSTAYDERPDWLVAGQALQRVLLYAAHHRVMAAFHTQPLELPRMRAQVRAGITAGRYPQMVLRLGRPAYTWAASRRPAVEVLRRGPVPARR